MFRKVITALLVVFIPVLCHGQTREKAAKKQLDKHRWDKAFSILKKSVRKDSTNVPAFYVLGQYYFARKNAAYHLDSAYYYTTRALSVWNRETDERTRLKWSRLPLDSVMILDQRRCIEAAAFEAAQYQGLEESYVRFIEAYPYAEEKQTAIQLRNAAAFEKALEENNYQAFQSFIDKYPDAQEVPRARARYEKLLFEYFTRDQRLESFELFLRDYPQTPYRSQAEKSIFQILTASGTRKAFFEFCRRYPESRYARIATNILYHIHAEDPIESAFPKELLTDSLSAVSGSERDYLVPFLTSNGYGFMNSSGKVVIQDHAAEIDDAYLCGNITEDVIVLPGKLLSRTGQILWSGDTLRALDDLGYGFLLAETAGGKFVLHKSIFRPVDFYVLNARVVLEGLLALETAAGWGVFSFTGKQIIAPGYTDISVIANVLVFQRGNTFTLSTASLLVSALGTDQAPFSENYDEVKRWGDYLWVRKGDTQGLLDQQLRTIIPFQTQALSPAFFGAVATTEKGFITYNRFGEVSEYFSALEVREPWVGARITDGWVLYDPVQRISKSVPYDTLMIFGNFAVGRKEDAIEIHLSGKPDFPLTLPKTEHIEFLPGRDSLSFLQITYDKKSSVYDAAGRLLFTGAFDRLQYAGSGLFVATRKEKKGLIDSSGKTILPFVYDAIGSAVDGTISLLRAMKFGLYDLSTRKLIPPSYDKNVQRFSTGIYTAFKETGLGFIDENNKSLGGFTFSEVLPWTDSVALVKVDGVFHLYNIHKREYELSGISRYRPVQDTPVERKYIVQMNNQMGVISNRSGRIIPVNFSDVVNVGSAERPLYFTEKHVKEASLFVVIYYDHHGTMIRREVYEQDEYDRIYCSD